MDKLTRCVYDLRIDMLSRLDAAALVPARADRVDEVRTLRVATRHPIELIDITDSVTDLVSQSQLWSGQVLLLSRHTTAALRIQEDEPLLLEDLRDFLARLAAPNAHYRHNDFRVRTHHMHPDERPNGHAHCLQLLLGSSEILPVIEGKLALGVWQRLFLIELDGPRPERKVLVQLSGASHRAGVDAWSTTTPARRARPVGHFVA
jgi:secondary thiamine-phosphate synthase enzyme